MISTLRARASARFFLLAVPLAVAFPMGAAHQAAAQHQYTCQPAHYDVVVPDYLGAAASVDVACAGSMTTMDVQWPFNDPSPEAWHNRYELNAADMTVSVTVGGEWLCTLQWIPNDGGTTRYLIAGCPEIYGGTGMAVPWNDPCIQKVRNRIYPDFWIFKNVVAQNGSTALRTMSRMLSGFAHAGALPGMADRLRGAEDPAMSVEPFETGGGVSDPVGAPPKRRRTPSRTLDGELPPGHTLTPPDTDILKHLERRTPVRQ